MTAFPLLVLTLFGACQNVEGDRITAKDLASSVPEFSSLPGSVSLGFAPLPGATRILTGSEIQRLAAQYGIKSERREPVCFDWPMRRMERGDVLRAMRDVLGADGIQLHEFSLFPAPPGTIVFPLSGLNRQPKGISFWRGYVDYAPDRRFNVWAKVKLDDAVAGVKAEVIGGSKVTVIVRSGAAELTLEAQAITSGSVGQMVTVRNPRSGRSFSAEVAGKDSVIVDAREMRK